MWSGSSGGVGGAAIGATLIVDGRDADGVSAAGVGDGVGAGAGASASALMLFLVLQSPLCHCLEEEGEERCCCYR